MAHRRYKWVMAPIATVLIFCLAVSAQVAQVEKVDLEMMKKIREEGIAAFASDGDFDLADGRSRPAPDQFASIQKGQRMG